MRQFIQKTAVNTAVNLLLHFNLLKFFVNGYTPHAWHNWVTSV